MVKGLVIVCASNRPSSPSATIGDPELYQTGAGFPPKIAAGMTIVEPQDSQFYFETVNKWVVGQHGRV